MKLSMRNKLIGSFLAVIVTTGAITTLVGVRMIGGGIVAQAQDKVRLDLNSAREIYQEALGDVGDAVRHTALRFFVREALAGGQMPRLAAELGQVRLREKLDVLTLTDSSGVVLVRTRNPAATGDGPPYSELVRRVLAGSGPLASTEIIPREALLREGADLAERARMRLLPTPMAKPAAKTEETSGMMIMAAAPVLDAEGRIVGALYGGRLVNREYGLVDKIKETVYQGESYRGREIGTATIFQGDLRISTNVMTEEGERAIGTRLSEEVGARVLEEGRPWTERAFVVNDWYMTAYEPIRDVSGSLVGILYVGMLERKFTDMKVEAILSFVGISLGGIALAVALCWLLSRAIVRPVGALVAAAQKLASGDLAQRVEPDGSTEEIGTLGRTFNMMAASLGERDAQMRRHAQEEILKSERLAMIGRLAAGVAHEINNPLGGILLLSKLLLRKAPPGSQEKENLDRIAKETARCQAIVQDLLYLARQRELATAPVNMNEVVERAMAMIEKQDVFRSVRVVRALAGDLPAVMADASQMQQVFTNIAVNAAEAMEGRGTLTIRSRVEEAGDRVAVSFSDTGCGIPPENMDKIFEPFFTTKRVGRGTGLGLSISHGIVARHGGRLLVESRPGAGSTFTVSLPRSLRG